MFIIYLINADDDDIVENLIDSDVAQSVVECVTLPMMAATQASMAHWRLARQLRSK